MQTQQATTLTLSNNLHWLKQKNSHTRDANINFYARGHKYEITTDKNSKYTSVTTWNHSHFPKFDADAIIANIFKSKSWGPDNKYWGLTADQIKDSWNSSAVAGTCLHECIERFMNEPQIQQNNYTHKDLYELYISKHFNNSICVNEWEYFIQFIKDFPDLKPYRTEWMIYDEDLKLAGSIDMVYENEDGTLSIYDWKRSKEIVKTTDWNKYALNPLIRHLPDTNFWHYSLQLNTYKAILERKYGKTVSKLCLVRLYPDATTYELLDVPFLTTEMDQLFEERQKMYKNV